MLVENEKKASKIHDWDVMGFRGFLEIDTESFGYWHKRNKLRNYLYLKTIRKLMKKNNRTIDSTHLK